MPQPPSRSKPRFALFSVGKNKASPARAASTKRASLRLSAARTEALRLPPEFTDAARLDPPDAKREQRGGSSDPLDTPSQDVSEIPVPDMKDTALPPLPQDAAPQAHASSSAPRPRPAQPSPSASANDARIPPPPPKSGPSRPPQHAATMPPTRTQTQTQTQAVPGPNIFRRLTSKLRPAPSASPSTSAKPSHAQNAPERKRSALRLPKAPAPAAPPNDFTSREQRQAALRARGLLPPSSAYRDAQGFMVPLSEQEAELDRRYTVVVEEKEAEARDAQESEAKKIREAWLARNHDAVAAASSSRPSLDVDPDDATRRASYDGKIGNRSAVQPTLVAPVEKAHAQEAKVEDFSAAAGQAANADPPGSPLSHSSAASEKVSRWLRSSTEGPTPLAVSTEHSATPSPLSDSPIGETASPAGTVRAAKPRKEKPPPIVVTTRPSQETPAKAKASAQLITVAVAALSESEASTSNGSSSLSTRGRAQSQGPHPPLLGHSTSSASSGSRSTTLPALSPTRTVSSSGADSTLPTPTTTSCQRDASISHGSTSHSSDQSHSVVRARRGSAGGDDAQAKVKASAKVAAGGIMQSSIEETDSSEEGEFGEARPLQAVLPPVPMARPRPQRAQTAEQFAEAQHNRKSFSLFGKKSSDSYANPNARTSSSMSNLRRAFSGGLTSKLQPRPRSSIDTSTSEPSLGPAPRTKMFDGSRMPPTSFPGAAGAVPLQGRTTGVGPRPRQALAPTMHSRGSILHQAHFIEDDESRRLSEMAFLT